MLIDIDGIRFYIFRIRTLDQVMIRQVFYQCTTAATYVKFFTKLAQVLFWTAAEALIWPLTHVQGPMLKTVFCP